MNKRTSFEQKITSSKLDVVKKSLYFIIIPIIILLVGIIMVSTVGFNKGIDFAGGYTFKVYVNNDEKLENTTSYDLANSEDYNNIYKKITLVLKNNDVDLISYQETNVNLPEYEVYDGQAVSVTFKTNEQSSEITAIRAELIDSFDYDNFDGAISSIDEVLPVKSFDLMIGLLSSVVFGLFAVVVYMAFRFSKSAIFVVFIQSALDIFLTLSLILICRVPVNLTVGIAVLVAFVMSLMNSFVYYNRVRDNRASGNFENYSNKDMANTITKQTLWKKILVYVAVFLATLLLIAIAPIEVKMVSLEIVFALIVTFYTSTFLLPSFWNLVDKPKKKKQKV